MNVNFTEKQQNYIDSLVKSGDYQNANEAVREAIRLHQVYRERIEEELRLEIEKGWQILASPRTPRDILRDNVEKKNRKKTELTKELIKGEKSSFVENFDRKKLLKSLHQKYLTE